MSGIKLPDLFPAEIESIQGHMDNSDPSVCISRQAYCMAKEYSTMLDKILDLTVDTYRYKPKEDI